jgi:SAM domain (Sterile alpha motif)
MQQIADWLEKLGMSEYAQRFAENDIDIEVLGELTDTDFDRLGVSIGHRRKLLKALAAGVPVANAARPSSAVGARLPPGPSQRCGSASYRSSRRRAPACDGDVLRSGGLDRHRRTARRRGMARPCGSLSRRGFCGGDGDGWQSRQEARRRADGAVGYPLAQENDAERAVRAALAIQRGLADLNRRNEGTGKPVLAHASRSIRGLWWSTRRAKFSATCRMTRRGRRRWPSRTRS